MRAVHIAGTNAKGSTAAYLAEILSQNGTCGLFTSPHLSDVRERFSVNGELIPKSEYDAGTARFSEKGKHPFAVWTDIAQEWFANKDVDFAVIETGLGGRKDPTNQFYSEIQMITPIALDHTEILGDTLKKIASEKCGIIEYGATVISHPQRDEAMRAIRRACDAMDARLFVLDPKDIRIRQRFADEILFDFHSPGGILRDLRIGTGSAAQAQNACAAVMAAQEFGADEDAVRKGLARTALPARIQVAGNVIADGGHNPAALAELAEFMSFFYKNTDVTLVAAFMQGKDLFAAARILQPLAQRVICTCADKKRGVPAKELCGYFDRATANADPVSAFSEARQTAERKKGVVLVCGSFYLAGKILPLLEAQPSL